MKRLFNSLLVVVGSLVVIWWLNIPFLENPKTKSISILVSTPIVADAVKQLLGPECNN
jgi:hypothetical protein